MRLLSSIFVLTFSTSLGATGYRAHVGSMVVDLAPQSNADGTLRAEVEAPVGAVVSVSGVNAEGLEGPTSNIVFAQAAATPTPTLASVVTATVRRTPTGCMGCDARTGLSVLYLGGIIDNGPHTTPQFFHDHWPADDAAQVEIPLPRQAIFSSFTVEDQEGTDWLVDMRLATKGGNPSQLGCQLGAEGSCIDSQHLASSDALSLYINNIAATGDTPLLRNPQAKVTLSNPLVCANPPCDWTPGAPYDAVVQGGGNGWGTPFFVRDGDYYMTGGGFTSGLPTYGGQSDPAEAPVVIPVAGGRVTGLAFCIDKPLGLDDVEGIALDNLTSKRTILTATIGTDERCVRLPTCTSADCPIYQFDRLAVRVICKHKGLPCSSNNQPEVGRFRNWSYTIRGLGGFLYYSRAFAWPKNPPIQNTPYSYWLCHTLGLDKGGINCSFKLAGAGEFISDLYVESTMDLPLRERVGVCTSATNMWTTEGCHDAQNRDSAWGCDFGPGKARSCRSSGILNFVPMGFWSLFVRPEIQPLVCHRQPDNSCVWVLAAPVNKSIAVSFVVHAGP